MRYLMFRSSLLLALFGAGMLFSPEIAAQEEPTSPFAALGQTLTKLAAQPPGKAQVSIYVADVVTGKAIFAKSADQLLNPASNAKIVTAACALKRLGPEFRFVTSLHGRRDGAAIRGPLYFKGHGDPTLRTDDIWELVHELRRGGVRRIEGGVVVDDSYFDEHNLPFAYDQQPDEDAAFRAPVGAVSLNRNTLAISIRPGPQGMRPARVVADPPDYAVLVNDALTVAEGAHNPKISATRFEDRTRIRVWGQVPLGSRSVTYYRRIDNPSLFTGYGLKGVLKESGISVGGGVRVGALPPGTPLLSERVSKPLSSVLWAAGKISNNFVSEMVLKVIGAEASSAPGTWEAAIAGVKETLAGWGLGDQPYQYRNGSGLYDANRFSARQLVAILRAAYLDITVRPEFLTQLATGGVDGTIKVRYRDRAAMRHVRAKTGTLADVSTLSGYVFDAGGQHPVAFSILLNDASGYVSSCRAYQERLVTAIANFLNP